MSTLWQHKYIDKNILSKVERYWKTNVWTKNILSKVQSDKEAKFSYLLSFDLLF